MSRIPSSAAAETMPFAVDELQDALADARKELLTCKQSLELSQNAVCAIADGIAITSLDGSITCLNPVATHLTGWTERESLGRKLFEIVRFTDAQGRAMDVLSEGFAGHHDDIVSLVRRDRHVILVDGTVAEIHGSDRKPIGSIVTFRNVTAATRLTRELSFHANHDVLTGLLNRRAFDAHLQRAVSTAAELGCHHAMLYFDLDQFKTVNDKGGHVAGDELLRQLATLLRGQLRERDTLARLGGDEFAVLLENCTAPHVSHVTEKLRSAIDGFAFSWGGRVFSLSASIGQVEFADDSMSAEDILSVADRMCYVAKTSGRNRIASHQSQGTCDATAAAHGESNWAHARRDENVQQVTEAVRAMRAVKRPGNRAEKRSGSSG